jgi:hypothetical protein
LPGRGFIRWPFEILGQSIVSVVDCVNTDYRTRKDQFLKIEDQRDLDAGNSTNAVTVSQVSSKNLFLK